MPRIPLLAVPPLFFVLALFLPFSAFAAPKTDVVVLKNGDRITGKVKALEQGRLKYETDNVGTIYVEWEDIASLTAARIFEFETIGGDLYHGSIEPGPEPGTFTIAEGAESRTMRFDELVRVVEVSSGWLEGIDGNLSLGLSYVRATELGQLSLSGYAVQRLLAVEKELTLSATFTRQPEQDDSERFSTLYTRRSFLAHRKYWWANVGVSSNSEIGLDARGQVGAGFGMSFVQTYASRFMGFAGLALSRENPTGDDPSETDLEGVLGVGYRVATYDFPKTKINVGLTVYPGLKPSGNARGMLDASISYEVFRDFTLGLTAYDDYDSEPRDPEAHTNDFGVTITVGWDF
jgi:hypothetical protein